jgi:BirA family biotin operon repressor/biotin-[acetyl-CoA-carboxylase] ligase
VSDRLPLELDRALSEAAPRLVPLCRRVLFFNRAGSTNDIALASAEQADAEGLVVIADEQTAGRGRQGRVWHSPPRSGLYVSMVVRLPVTGAGTPLPGLLTLGAGVSIAEAIETTTGLRADVKWPNDLVVGRRKLAGILAESAPRHTGLVVLGYGINVSMRAFPPEMEGRATSLEAESGRPVDPVALCVETIAAIAQRHRALLERRFDDILDAWRGRSPSCRHRRVAWDTPTGKESGLTEGIDDRGALLVRVGERVERIVGGTVTWLDQ